MSYELVDQDPHLNSHETIETLPDKHYHDIHEHHSEHHLHHTECALILNGKKQYINEYTNFHTNG